jgi:hypothetical protein
VQQRPQVVGQPVRRWQLRAVHEHRYHAHAGVERGRHLPPHEVARVVDAATTARGGRVEPPQPDHDQDHVARPDRGVDLLREVGAGRDGDHVVEHRIVAEAAREGIGQAARTAARVVPPVAEEDLHADRSARRHGPRGPRRP